MLLLALDTATPAVTAALHDGTQVIAESTRTDARRHGELLLPAVDRVLGEAGRTLADLTGIVVGVGPGPYTGLRVGLVTAATFGAALDLPVYGLCTLDGIAHAAGQAGLEGPFVVATDARRKEVYWARYDSSRTRVTEPAVDRPAEIAEQVAGLPAVGAGALLYPDSFGPVPPGMPENQSAGALAALAAEKLAAGESVASGGFLPDRPLYLRRPDAQVPANYKVVTPS
ncbi:tRNA (adenosine(37)-N6)-threonylcarbamoyltransferase complex dimerization subunit type 1 TsaB [Streptomyces palmae]|uniref:tRNA (Adenosine(37)-N6)-threonylcarbamoyltransferase complex dimerization subunit type 1 TsaB n=1 Tax=Streptomyces palmae TaxID=1701085 RepID=A0A4Z0HBK5_9ACTN|nr:tRNA (adenosine(37)-N6)-threonylcarbamoyltransferase complex dimerization subunit type 1 TsaB [Streptomyces palmae]TGB16566.1 tRNA (adenosine(37)-N6)-threonylcarbamoyltransferase complex dimerization subunit type 1 TsaB [Streptomyces palmae]